MTWNIVSDSSCDLRMASFQSETVRFETVPLRIQVGTREFLDNDDLSVPELLHTMASEKSAASTSCPSPHAFAHAFAAGIGHDMVDPLLQEDIAVLHGHFRLDLAARIFVRIGNAADHSQRDRFGLDGESPAGAGEIFRPVEIAARRNVYREGISPRVRGGAVQLFAVSIIIGDGDLAAANALFGNDFYLLLFSVICNLFGRNNKVVGGQGAALGDRHRDGIVGDGVIFRGDAPFSTDKMRIIYARRYGITARLLQRSRIGDDRLAAVDGDINRDGRLGIRRL